jgi:hypothetical protein
MFEKMATSSNYIVYRNGVFVGNVTQQKLTIFASLTPPEKDDIRQSAIDLMLIPARILNH